MSAVQPTVAGVLLAAGASVRLGRNKLLLEVEGEPLVRRATRQALEAGLAPLVVVVGHEGVRVRAALAGLGCELVEHAGWAAGMGSSLAAGVRAVPAGVDGVVVLLADMPRVGPEVLREVVARRRASGAPVVATRYGAVNAPPTFFEASLLPRLAALAGDAGPREIVAELWERVAVVARGPEELLDVDGPGDLDGLAGWAAAEARR